MAKKKAPQKTKITTDTKILLEIERPAFDGLTRNVLSLGSYVEEVIDCTHLLIKAPIHRGYNYLLPRDKPILAYFFIGTRMFSLMLQVQEQVQREGLAYVKVRVQGDLQQNQRRDCFRLQQCNLPITAERVPKVKTDPPIHADCTILNFSDGGMLFATHEEMEIGEAIILHFDIGTVESVDAEVLRLETPTEGAYRHNVAVKFLHKCRKQKNRFYVFIVQQQRARLRQQAEANTPQHSL